MEAARLTSVLVRYAGKHLETHVVAYDVAMNRNKPLLALQALSRGKRLAAGAHILPPDLSYRIAHFFHTIKTQTLHPTVAEVIR